MTNGVATFGNTSDYRGRDLVVETENTYGSLRLADRMLGGGKIHYYLDDVENRQSNDHPLYLVPEGSFSHDRGSRVVTALYSQAEDHAEELARGLGDIVVIRNRAAIGGGVANNGLLIIGEDADLRITVEKVWSGTASHPDRLTLVLYQSEKDSPTGTPGAAKVLETVEMKPDASGNWVHVFRDLPSYHTSADGSVEIYYEYRVEEETLSGYTSNSSVDDGDPRHIRYVFTNHSDQGGTQPTTIDVNVQKAWSGGDTHPASVTVNLLQNGRQIDAAVLSAANGWTHSFTGLPKSITVGGVTTQYEYTVKEDVTAGYLVTYNKTIGGSNISYTITNQFLPPGGPGGNTGITVQKRWSGSGTHPESVTVKLLQNGADYSTTTLNEANNWTHTFENLPLQSGGSNAYSYSVQEVVPEGYRESYTVTPGAEGLTIVITNQSTGGGGDTSGGGGDPYTPPDPANLGGPGTPNSPNSPGGGGGSGTPGAPTEATVEDRDIPRSDADDLGKRNPDTGRGLPHRHAR